MRAIAKAKGTIDLDEGRPWWGYRLQVKYPSERTFYESEVYFHEPFWREGVRVSTYCDLFRDFKERGESLTALSFVQLYYERIVPVLYYSIAQREKHYTPGLYSGFVQPADTLAEPALDQQESEAKINPSRIAIPN